MFDCGVIENSNRSYGGYIGVKSSINMPFWVDIYFCKQFEPAKDTIRLIKDDNFVVDIKIDLSYCSFKIFKNPSDAMEENTDEH